MGKIDLNAVPEQCGTGYPKRFHAIKGDILKRNFRRVGQAGGLTQFGVNWVRLESGGVSSLRHWHMQEDEFIVVLEGELVMITDEGEAIMHAGDMAAFPKGVENGHHFLNRSARDAVLLAVGTKNREEVAYYSDVDMMVGPGDAPYRTRAGTVYGDIPEKK